MFHAESGFKGVLVITSMNPLFIVTKQTPVRIFANIQNFYGVS